MATPATGCSRSCAPHVADERVLERRCAPSRATCSSPPELRARGVGQRRRCRSAAGQTISQPLVVARMCELLELHGRRARARRRHRLGLPRRAARAARARTCGAIERHARAVRAGARATSRAAGVDERDAASSATARAACPSTRAVRRDQRRRRRRRRRPARARASSSRPAAGWSRRSRTATSGSCVVRRTAARLRAHARSSACASCRSVSYLDRRLEARVRAVLAPDLRARPAVDHHDVGGEVVGAADQRRADAVGVDGHAGRLERADALGGEAAGDDDLHVSGSRARRARRASSSTSSAATPVGASSPWRRAATRRRACRRCPAARPTGRRRAPRRPRAPCAPSRWRSRRARSRSCRRPKRSANLRAASAVSPP